jgi:hypothetical protein
LLARGYIDFAILKYRLNFPVLILERSSDIFTCGFHSLQQADSPASFYASQAPLLHPPELFPTIERKPR